MAKRVGADEESVLGGGGIGADGNEGDAGPPCFGRARVDGVVARAEHDEAVDARAHGEVKTALRLLSRGCRIPEHLDRGLGVFHFLVDSVEEAAEVGVIGIGDGHDEVISGDIGSRIRPEYAARQSRPALADEIGVENGSAQKDDAEEDGEYARRFFHRAAPITLS